jgi:hypothetical protein
MIEVLLQAITSCASFAPADLRPLRVVGWLNRFSTGSFDAAGNLPPGNSLKKFSCNNHGQQIPNLYIIEVVIAIGWQKHVHFDSSHS